MTNSDEPIVYQLEELSGFEFEDAVCRIFRRQGYDAKVAERVADLGRDVVVETDETTFVVECKLKRGGGTIGRPVVQKLHSATVSLDIEAEGIIVTTGSFSSPAMEHARELPDVRLWDHQRLVKEAEQVDIYFASRHKNTTRVFWPGDVPEDETNSKCWRQFVDNVDSAPATVDELLEVNSVDDEYIPALLLEYELDETFGTSTYPNLHRATESGRIVEPIDRERLKADIWNDISFSEQAPETVAGRPAESYFGVDPSPAREELSRRVARRKSTSVTYTGKNNQTYTKDCQVEPDDVRVTSRQVLLRYRQLTVTSVDQTLTFEFAVAQHISPELADSDPVRLEDAKSIWDGDEGLLCNRCGLIESTSTSSPARCKTCDKTLCSEHHWRWPRRAPMPWAPLCESCYCDREDDTLESYPGGNYASGIASSLLPGLSFLLSGRYISGSLLGFFGAIAGLAFVGASMENKSLAPALITAAIAVTLSLMTTLYWLKRIRHHRENLTELTSDTSIPEDD